MFRSITVAATIVVCLFAARSALAQELDLLWLEPSRCDVEWLSSAELQAMLEAELRGAGKNILFDMDEPWVVIHLSCTGASVVVQVDRGDGVVEQRDASFEDVEPAARTRAISLMISDMVVAVLEAPEASAETETDAEAETETETETESVAETDAEAEAETETVAETETETVAETDAEAEAETETETETLPMTTETGEALSVGFAAPESGTRLGVGANLQLLWPSGGNVLWGADAYFFADTDVLFIEGGAGFMTVSGDDPLGTATINILLLGLSGGVWILDAEPVRLAITLRGRGGFAWASATPGAGARASSGQTLVTIVGAGLRTEFELGSALSLTLSLGAEQVLNGITARADDRVASGFDGFHLSGQLGFQIRLETLAATSPEQPQ